MSTLWAPWRLDYILDSASREEGCFFCNAWNQAGEEKNHLVLARGRGVFVMMNRYPYSNGHLLVAPVRHIGGVEDMTPDEGGEVWRLVSVCKAVLMDVMRAEGCNIGVNQGKVAGAGVLDHVHVHIVPRWNGDTNFMPVIADTRVMPQALEACFERLRPAFEERGF